ncbi:MULTISPECIES: LolA family protein [Yersinia]|jgi:outer membrane lipoprotein-sorting protein|uniref:Outer membrane lipoprotein carrier protein LolA n=1 Tax=Yersinia intermedia TaxID=631 RepID=A0A0T9MRP7_YERIN|nr:MULTISPECIES: outer membrane lipoprotein carrier protein LolA [Yersinia]AJJ19536.1 outer membrane lipocarrier LolA family protein [Yersinia intermedia]ARB84043.1 outer membrane lipoprotein carrier protein LolA [Yersinia sp. FDAARGOS_228]AVL37839.1 outer membrane lipoprotein carrier protein LolA [Yersinia intermedia]MCB5298156.1 outer membrane lipoprotein carrier protein LolA [Yersinia intermedia]MDA5482515.1 outer membrane lipoprotein carrier protein LolA [Yersinia intermedia]
MKSIFTVLLLCLSLSAHAVTLASLQQRFSEQPVLRAEFEQQRSISGMNKPLKSSGNLLISRDKGLWWSQQQPFVLTLLLDDKRMVQTMAGQPAQVITADSNPQMFQFNHLLTALFHADTSILEQNFTLAFTDSGQDRWVLVLTPKTTPLDKLFKSITLHGQYFLETIDIEDMQGDGTHIRFFNQLTEPKILSHAEQQLFAH